MLKVLICRVCLCKVLTTTSLGNGRGLRNQWKISWCWFHSPEQWQFFEGKLFMKTRCKQGVLQSSVSAPVVLPLAFKTLQPESRSETHWSSRWLWVTLRNAFIQDCVVLSCRDKKRCEGQWSSGRVASGPANQFSASLPWHCLLSICLGGGLGWPPENHTHCPSHSSAPNPHPTILPC